MTQKKTGKTAAEVIAELERDQSVAQARAAYAAEIEARVAREAAEAAPLLSDLAKVGCPVHSVWDFTAVETPRAVVPVLVEHLVGGYCDRTREGIARALETRHARDHWDKLVAAFKAFDVGTSGGAKVALGITLGAIADDAVAVELLELAKDARHGAARLGLLERIARLEDGRVDGLLKELSVDPELEPEVRRVIHLRRRLETSSRKPEA